MNLQTIIEKLGLKVLTTPVDFKQVIPTSGYSSDLLSCVMAGAKKDCLWITLQSHDNIVAVAALLEMAAVIITEDAQPEPSTVTRANGKNIIILSTPHSNFTVIGKLWELGLRSE
jgi:hypothetical protein